MDNSQSDDCLKELASLLDGCKDAVAALSSFAAVIHRQFEAASWTGFYRVVEADLLCVGPYQGPPGCLEIPFHEGVCGKAARLGLSQLVDDVTAFPDHIACDPHARSEIVIPVFDAKDRVAAVLDVDSHHRAAFSQEDKVLLERATALLTRFFPGDGTDESGPPSSGTNR